MLVNRRIIQISQTANQDRYLIHKACTIKLTNSFVERRLSFLILGREGKYKRQKRKIVIIFGNIVIELRENF